MAQGITDASKRRATFLSYCGPEIFKLAKALLAPAKLSETPLKDILACLTSHLAPTETKMARRMEFHKRQQRAGESVSAFLAELRKLAQHCDFQDLEETLLDRFIGGLSSKKARRRIVAKEEVTLASALKEATATENYEREELDASRKAPKPQIEVAHAMDELEATPSQSPVRGVESVRQACTVHKDHRGRCPGCGGNHERKSCRFRDAMCRTCGKTGHIARVCRSAALEATGAPRLEHRRPPTANHVLKDCHYVTEINGRVVQFPAQGKAHVKVKIEGQLCDMEVDSGSGFTIVSDQTARTFFPRGKLPPLEPFPATLQSYSAGRIQVMGMCAVRVQFRDKQAVLKLVIAKGSRPSLLGTDWFPALGLSISGLNSIQTCPEMSEALCKEFAGLFNGKLGCYKGPQLTSSWTLGWPQSDSNQGECHLHCNPRSKQSWINWSSREFSHPWTLLSGRLQSSHPLKQMGKSGSVQITNVLSIRHSGETHTPFQSYHICWLNWLGARCSPKLTWHKLTNSCQ